MSVFGQARAVGVIFAHGAATVSDAIQACREGKATPKQQQIVAQMLDALVSH